MKKTISTILIFILVIMLGVGIAYAYFAARIIGQEKASTISLTGGKMIIEYSENSGVIELSGIYPKADAWATKIITVKGTNSTNTTMKYDLGLNVIENTFRNSYISYDLKLIDGNNGTPISNITGKYINGTDYKRFGIGSFANANEEIHQYELKIYFKNNGKDQNDAQRAVFNAKVEIRDGGVDLPESEITMFLGMSQVNVKMKTLANLANNDNSGANQGTANTTITAINESLTEPTSENKEEKNIVSTSTSKYPIYMWYDDGTIYWWSEEKHPYLNSSSENMFRDLQSLVDISGLSNFIATKAQSFGNIFYNDKMLTNISPLSNWDVSNVTDISSLFNVTSVNDLSSIKNWNISNVKKMTGAFANTKINDLAQLSNWDVSNVTDMGNLFNNNKNLNSLTGIEKWDVSNVTSMSYAFKDYQGTSLAGLEEWNVSKVENMTEMFAWNNKLTDASAINNWDVSNVATFRLMFNYVPIHPEFTQIEGTWSGGTFIPNS